MFLRDGARYPSDGSISESPPEAAGLAYLSRHLQLLTAKLRDRLGLLHLRSSEVGFLRARSERIADGELCGPVREIVREQISEHGTEASLRLSDDRSGESRTALELRAAETLQPVVELRVHLRKRLVALIAHVDVGDLERLLRPQQVRASIERTAHGGLDVHCSRLEWRQIAGFDVQRPEVGHRRIEDQGTKRILRRRDLRLRHASGRHRRRELDGRRPVLRPLRENPRRAGRPVRPSLRALASEPGWPRQQQFQQHPLSQCA